MSVFIRPEILNIVNSSNELDVLLPALGLLALVEPKRPAILERILDTRVIERRNVLLLLLLFAAAVVQRARRAGTWRRARRRLREAVVVRRRLQVVVVVLVVVVGVAAVQIGRLRCHLYIYDKHSLLFSQYYYISKCYYIIS